MKIRVSRFAFVLLAGAYLYSIHLDGAGSIAQAAKSYSLVATKWTLRRPLVVSLRSEPKTLNPVYFARYLIPRSYRPDDW